MSLCPKIDVALELVRWEDMVPGMGRPESVILEQADIDDTDLFIGILTTVRL